MQRCIEKFFRWRVSNTRPSAIEILGSLGVFVRQIRRMLKPILVRLSNIFR